MAVTEFPCSLNILDVQLRLAVIVNATHKKCATKSHVDTSNTKE